MPDTLYVFYMMTQDEIQRAMSTLLFGLSKREVKDTSLPFGEVLKQHPDIKAKWDILMKEAEELRSKGQWKYP